MRGPIDTVNELVQAINHADLERAVAAYESDAVLVVQPGKLVRGSAQLQEALAGFIALRVVLRSEAQQLIEPEDVALYVGRWSLSGTIPRATQWLCVKNRPMSCVVKGWPLVDRARQSVGCSDSPATLIGRPPNQSHAG